MSSLPNIKGGFPGVGQYYDQSTPKAYYSEDTDSDGLYGAFIRKNTENQTPYGVKVTNGTGAERDDYFGFDASKSNSVYGRYASNNNLKNEVLPKAIHMVACRKN